METAKSVAELASDVKAEADDVMAMLDAYRHMMERVVKTDLRGVKDALLTDMRDLAHDTERHLTDEIEARQRRGAS